MLPVDRAGFVVARTNSSRDKKHFLARKHVNVIFFLNLTYKISNEHAQYVKYIILKHFKIFIV